MNDDYRDYVPDGQKRAGNADRDRYVEHLSAAVATGHLNDEEFDRRSRRALAAITMGELGRLVSDLPSYNQVNKGRTRKVRCQVAEFGSVRRFSAWRWGLSLLLSSALIVMPGPILAAKFHGFDHAWLAGDSIVFMILAGVFTLLFLGVGFAPTDSTMEIPE